MQKQNTCRLITIQGRKMGFVTTDKAERLSPALSRMMLKKLACFLGLTLSNAAKGGKEAISGFGLLLEMGCLLALAGKDPLKNRIIESLVSGDSEASFIFTDSMTAKIAKDRPIKDLVTAALAASFALMNRIYGDMDSVFFSTELAEAFAKGTELSKNSMEAV